MFSNISNKNRIKFTEKDNTSRFIRLQCFIVYKKCNIHYLHITYLYFIYILCNENYSIKGKFLVIICNQQSRIATVDG